LLFVFLFFLLPSAFGAKPSKRPKVGVVLSGGGAKGFAHIAVLRAIEELNIPVDYIGGTSMGSTVAALYAMGYTVDELEKLARETDWYRYFQNSPDRDNESIRRRIYFQEFPFTFDIGKDGISVPKGFVNGQRIGLFLSRLTWDYHNVEDFHKLPVPFLCVATDFEKGEGVVLDRGNLAESLRASMAIPSVFNPVELNGNIFLDGGVVNNFPVKEVRAMGADIIIGIDVSSRLYKKEDLDSLPKIMDQAISFLGERMTIEQRAGCDILIIPDVSDMGAQDFDRTDEIIKRGEKATELQLDKLRALSEKLRKYNPEKRDSTKKIRGRAVRADRIYLHGLEKVSKGIVKQYMGFKPGDTVTPGQLEEAINRIYGLNFFERINYDFEDDNGINSLHIYFTERSENRLYFGVAYDTDIKGAALLGLEIRGLGLKNSELILKGRFGEYSKLDFSYIIYTPINPGIGIEVNSDIYKMDLNVYQGSRVAGVYELWQQSDTISLNTYYSNWLLLSLGMRKEFYSVDSEIVTSTDAGRYEFDLLAFYGRMAVDTLDDYTFPRRGILLSAQIDYIRSDMSYYDKIEFDNYERNMLNLKIALPLGEKLSLRTGLAGSTVSGETVHPSYWFVMGGNQRYEDWIYPLSGYELMEKTGNHGWVYSVDLQYEALPDCFLSVKWNEGKVTDDVNELYRYRDTEAGYGVSLGYRSPFGPLQAGFFRKAYESDYSAYFNVGFIF